MASSPPFVRCVEDVTYGDIDDLSAPPRSAGLKGRLGVAIPDVQCDSLIWFLPNDKELWLAAVTKRSGPDAWHIPRAWVRPTSMEWYEYEVDWRREMRVGAKVQVTMGATPPLEGTVVELRQYEDGSLGHVGVLIKRTNKVWFVHPNLIANDALVVGAIGR